MMRRSLVVHDIPVEDFPAMERWYFRYHAPEIVRRYGPWLTRFESWLPAPSIAEAQQFGLMNWRVTQGWWRDIPLPGAMGTLAFTPPPVRPRIATCFIPAQPTEDFLGGDVEPDDHNVLRWLILLRYPEGVSKEEGEKWFLETHAPEVMRQQGLYRFFSFRVTEQIHLPGTWRKSAAPPPGTVAREWDRVVELWYDNFRDWKRAIVEAPVGYTAPPWAPDAVYPFLKPGENFVSSFLPERPADDFLRDSRAYLL